MSAAYKFAICEWSLPWNGRFGVEFANKLGFQGMELDLGPYQYDLPLSKKEMQRAYLAAGQKYGIEYTSMAVNTVNTVNSMTSPPGQREHYLAVNALKRAVDACEAMGIPIIQVPSFYDGVLKTDEDIRRTALCYREACRYAEGKNIILASENALEKEEFQRMREMVDMDNFMLFFDTQNYWKHKGWDTPTVYNELAEFCVPQIHVKDGRGITSSALLGEGDAKFFETAAEIKKSGFTGWIILENYYDQPPLCDENHDPWELIAKDLATAQRVFRDSPPQK